MKVTLLAVMLIATGAATIGSAPPPRSLARAMIANGSAGLDVSSPAFKPNDYIPFPYSAEGEAFSPALSWQKAPGATRSFVVIVEDPDAATPKPFVHWVIYNLPATVSHLDESVPAIPQLPQLQNAKQGRNSRGTIGYVGPRPPEGDPAHHYHFQVLALDTMLQLPPAADALAILDASKGHVVASGETIGLFRR
jgi:Raf kinase inhibitor-like YbhB/YbcL family protein